MNSFRTKTGRKWHFKDQRLYLLHTCHFLLVHFGHFKIFSELPTMKLIGGRLLWLS